MTVNTTPHTSIFHSELHALAWLKLGSALTPSMFHCVSWCVCLIALSSTIPLSSSSPSSLLSPCLSFRPSTSSSRMWWTNSLCTSAIEVLGTLAEYDPLTGYEPNDYHITEAYMNTTPRNPRSSSGTRMTSTAMTSPSARRSLMRAEDEPISLKKKVSRPVCRRPSVMLDRKDPL